VKATAYHAGMTGDKRSKIQNDFMENKFKVIVATIAFGMGVDKADIRFVIHVGMPSSPEGYYQEAGRAGRDGEKAFCILLHSKSDASLHHFFIMANKGEMASQGKSWEDSKIVTNIKYARLDKMKEYVGLKTCRRLLLLDYFGDPAVKNHSGNCKGCDVCLDYKWEKTPEVEAARKIKKASTKNNQSLAMESDTVMETVKLYQQKYSAVKIAKARSLGVSTIFNHLTRWYLEGGELDVADFVTADEERQILSAIKESAGTGRITAIKEHAGENISYEQIRLVLAKRKLEKN
jgi:superfamily II DNA helicase RecQ